MPKKEILNGFLTQIHSHHRKEGIVLQEGAAFFDPKPKILSFHVEIGWMEYKKKLSQK